MTLKASDRAYIAGFFDGEGCVSLSRTKRSVPCAIRIGQKDPTILEYIQEVLEMGRIYHRSDNGPKKNGSFYTFVVYRQTDVDRFIRLIYPYVRDRSKRRRLREVRSILQAKKEALA